MFDLILHGFDCGGCVAIVAIQNVVGDIGLVGFWAHAVISSLIQCSITGGRIVDRCSYYVLVGKGVKAASF